MASRRFRLRLEPYNPDARDADGDGIVQEGTAWERPAGARILNELGEEVKRGSISSRRNEKFSVTDKDGKRLDYIPSYAKQAKIPTERPKTSLEKRGIQTIKSRGIRNVDEVVTEAVALSRASEPGTPRQDEPTPTVRSSEPDIPTEKPKAPTELTAGPELVADLLPDVAPIKLLTKPRPDGSQSASNDIAIIREGGRSRDLFGWEETPAGKKALDSLLEAGGRALAFLEQSLAKKPITDEIRKEIDELRKQIDESKGDRERVLAEIHRLKHQAWLDRLTEVRAILPASDDGTITDSQRQMDEVIQRATKKLAKFDRDGKIGEIITKKDMETIRDILISEQTKAFQKYIMNNDAENYDRWFDSDGNTTGPWKWADSVSGDDDAMFERLRLEERARQTQIAKDGHFELGEKFYEILLDDSNQKFTFVPTSSFFHPYINSERGFPAKETREIRAELLAKDVFPQEYADLESALQKRTVPVEVRKRLNQLDPLSNPDENSKAFLKLLSSVRSDIGDGDFLGYFDQSKIVANGADAGISGVTKESMIETINEVNSKLPGTWVSRFRQTYGPLRRNDLRFLRRGHFEHGQIRLSSGQYTWRSTLLHELTHGFEVSVPGLYLAERLFYNRRAKAIPKNKLVKKYYGTGQYYWDLQLSDNYASVFYSLDNLEVASQSIEILYAGEIRRMPPDQAKFIIGCMLLL